MVEAEKGKLVIISAPSGAGKSTIVNKLIQAPLNLHFSVSACSRPPRGDEKHGKDYYFLGVGEFKKKIEASEFLEWEEVYPGRYYGTLKSEVERITAMGDNVIFDVDVIGGLNIKKEFSDEALAIFIMPPDFRELERRLRQRSTESEEELSIRLAKAVKELKHAPSFDRIIINDDLEEAVAEAIQAVSDFLKHKKT